MLPDNEFLLIDHLDKNLSADDAMQVEARIRSDKALASEWEFLKMAVEAVELAAIREQVMSTRKSFEAVSLPAAQPAEGMVRRMYKTALRIAAVLILLTGISLFYKYNTVNNDSLYRQYFTDYTLNTSRGQDTPDALEEAYRHQNWNEVMATFNQESGKTSRSYFLAGMASLKLQNYAAAVADFEHILTGNTKSGERYFQDEAEYYLALAYLMDHQTEKGVSLLNLIRANKDHAYYPLAAKIPSTDLKIITLKNKK
jgi:hypothetical protein